MSATLRPAGPGEYTGSEFGRADTPPPGSPLAPGRQFTPTFASAPALAAALTAELPGLGVRSPHDAAADAATDVGEGVVGAPEQTLLRWVGADPARAAAGLRDLLTDVLAAAVAEVGKCAGTAVEEVTVDSMRLFPKLAAALDLPLPATPDEDTIPGL